MKKNKKIVLMILIILVIIFININNCFARNTIEDLGPLNNYKGNIGQVDKLTSRASTIVAIIRNVGAVLSVIILIIIGFKYMLGSVEERAEYKKTLVPYIIGAFLVFTISVVPTIIYQFVKNI